MVSLDPTNITFDLVLTLAQRLDQAERLRLIETLQSLPEPELTPAQKAALWQQMGYPDRTIGQFSDRREDWYDDDGR